MDEMLIQCPFCGGQIKISYNLTWHSDGTGVWFDEPIKLPGELRYDSQREVGEATRRGAKQWKG